MKPTEILLRFVEDELSSIADPLYAKKMSDYMKDHFEFYGVNAGDRNQLLKTIKLKCKSLDIEDLISFARVCWDRDFRELQYIAIDLLKWRKKYLTTDYMQDMEYLLIHKSWWDSVDLIASNLVGAALEENKTEQYRWSEKWILSDNMWLRRSAIIHQLKYKSKVDQELLFALIESQTESTEFFINKACGWALRQYSKTNPQAVSQFLNYHPRLSNLTVREASKYL